MEKPEKKYKIILTGGGTGGSVAPLLAIYDELKSDGRFDFLWLGTKYGPEKRMVEKEGIKFRAISGGKWRRYFSLKNLTDIFKIKLGFWQALFIMLAWRPSLVMSAGSFTSVPVVWAAWVLRVPVMIHQQDVRPGLANRLMARFAKMITVTFKKSLKDYGKEAVWVGNPVRESLKVKSQKLKVKSIFNLTEELPMILILGGGTGSVAINRLVEENLEELTKLCQVIHITGKNKNFSVILEPKAVEPQSLEVNRGDPIAPFSRSRMTNYRTYEFLDAVQMAEAYKLADIVVTRAGLGVLSELSYLGKPSIIIPLPDSHQEENARMFENAGLVLEQNGLTAGKFLSEIKKLLNDKELQKALSGKISEAIKRGAEAEIVEMIKKLVNK